MNMKLCSREWSEFVKSGDEGYQKFQRSDSSSFNQAGFSVLNDAECWRWSANVLTSWLLEEPSMNSGVSGTTVR